MSFFRTANKTVLKKRNIWFGLGDFCGSFKVVGGFKPVEEYEANLITVSPLGRNEHLKCC